ncbi:MAG: VOC family protein [Myxococcota bacterium]
MQASIDHVVLWVDDVERAITFYTAIVGCEGVRLDEFRAGKAPFPSVRVGDGAILDLMARQAARALDALAARPGSAGHPVNHVCLALSAAELAALRARLDANGVVIAGEMQRSYGARGFGRAWYFHDSEGNVLEARTYDP